MAAVHLLQGQYTDRPKRAITINPAGSKDFAQRFATERSAPEAALHLVNILSAALVFEKNKRVFECILRKELEDVFENLRRLKDSCWARHLETIEVI
jgi:hypothetical protein